VIRGRPKRRTAIIRLVGTGDILGLEVPEPGAPPLRQILELPGADALGLQQELLAPMDGLRPPSSNAVSWTSPEPEKVVTFDDVAGIVASLSQAITVATTEQLEALVGMLLTRMKVTVDGRYEIEPVPSAQPFFATRESLLRAPPDGLEPPTQALGRPRSVH
jgi:hypothetical protein